MFLIFNKRIMNNIYILDKKVIFKMPNIDNYINKIKNNLIGNKTEFNKALKKLKDIRTGYPNQHKDVVITLTNKDGHSERVFYIHYDPNKKLYELYAFDIMWTNQAGSYLVSRHKQEENVYEKILTEFNKIFRKIPHYFINNFWNFLNQKQIIYLQNEIIRKSKNVN